MMCIITIKYEVESFNRNKRFNQLILKLNNK